MTWENPTEYYTQYSPTLAYSDVKKSYDEFLPNIDASLAVTKDFILRASYSKTITRSPTSMDGFTLSVAPSVSCERTPVRRSISISCFGPTPPICAS